MSKFFSTKSDVSMQSTSGTSIKSLKSGEFKCAVCNVKFKTKDGALKHLKTPEHIKMKKELQNQEATQQSMAQSTAMLTTLQQEVSIQQEQQEHQMQIINSQLELLLNKLDLLSERVNHVELRLAHFQAQFEEHLIQPRIQELKVKETIERDQVLKGHLDEVKQIELAEQLIKTKLNEQKMQTHTIQPFGIDGSGAGFPAQVQPSNMVFSQAQPQQPFQQSATVPPIPSGIYTTQQSQFCTMCGSHIQ